MRTGGSSSCHRAASSRSWTWPRLRRPSPSLTRSLSFSPSKVNQGIILFQHLTLFVSVYLVSSTRSCVSSPNIKYPCVNAFSACLQSSDVHIQTAAIKILSEIFR